MWIILFLADYAAVDRITNQADLYGGQPTPPHTTLEEFLMAAEDEVGYYS